jgi:hypothetical protein
MAGNFQAPPRAKNALDEYKLRLSCPPVQGAQKPGSFAISLVANNPRFDVYTNVPNDKNNGNIRAAMDMPTFYMVLAAMEDALTLEDSQVLKIQNLNHTFFEGKRSDQPKLVSTTCVGRDKEGCLFIAVVAKDRPYLKFNLLPTNYHVMLGVDGNPLDKRQASNYFMRGYAGMLKNMMAAVAVKEYVEPVKKDFNGGNQQQQRPQQQRQGGGDGGGWKQREQNSGSDRNFGGDDDDFPM